MWDCQLQVRRVCRTILPMSRLTSFVGGVIVISDVFPNAISNNRQKEQVLTKNNAKDICLGWGSIETKCKTDSLLKRPPNCNDPTECFPGFFSFMARRGLEDLETIGEAKRNTSFSRNGRGVHVSLFKNV